jgi:ribosomal protein S27AE
MTDDRSDSIGGQLISADAAERGQQVRGVPSDNTTLTSVLDGLAEEGFTEQLMARPDRRVECGACGAESDAADLDVASVRRLEGASDPDDMMAVVAAACTRCGAGGTLVLGFGPNASDDDTDVARALPEPDIPR